MPPKGLLDFGRGEVQPILEVQDLSKRFSGIEAVSELSFAVAERRITGLIGPNGAGKTTVFNLITGALRPDSGRVFLGDRRLDRLSPDQIARHGVARTFQIPRPFRELTVHRNVATAALLHANGLKEADDAALGVLREVGLFDKRDRMAGELGIADRKRLELARALAVRPKVLLLDEVFSGLTPTEVDNLVSIARDISERNVTILLVEHVMRVVMRLCSEVIVIDRGRCIAKGTPDEIVKDPATLRAYLGEASDGVA